MISEYKDIQDDEITPGGEEEPNPSMRQTIDFSDFEAFID